jgi:hypothetical protein
MMTVPLIASAAHHYLVLKDAEPQYANHLCWAAADVLAVNQFYPKCPQPAFAAPAVPPLFPTSQSLDAAYNVGGAANLSWALWHICEPNVGTCNKWDFPPLNGLIYKWGKDFLGSDGRPDPNGLDWKTMTAEINLGHPVLFVWNYSADKTPPGSPVGEHELVVVGYSDDSGTQELQIWDPWPVPKDPLPTVVPPCGPASGINITDNHSWPIPFSTYQNPLSDMGLGATAEHERDQWALAIAHTAAPSVPNPPEVSIDVGPPPSPPPPPPPPPFHAPQPPPGATPQQSFTKALSMAVPQSRQLRLQGSGAAPRSVGVPFPIVGLGFVQLLGAADEPTKLLAAGTTSAILFPVESQGQVVDAFLLLLTRGGWQRGGYANIEITRRLVDVRAAYAARQHLPLESFYMVSVPGEVAFFAAYGKGKQAVLIPASTDPSIDAFAGVAVPAEKQLRELILAIQRDLLRHPARTRDTVRPRS